MRVYRCRMCQAVLVIRDEAEMPLCNCGGDWEQDLKVKAVTLVNKTAQGDAVKYNVS